jgi:hypothetical protein
MPRLIAAPVVIEAAGTRPKLIEELVGGIRYSTPHPDGAEYVAICLPAFSPATVHRDA